MSSLYSMEKERRSISIRRSKSRGQTGRINRESQGAESEDSTHKSLERMYTFNLSKTTKTARQKAKREKQQPKGDAADTPAFKATTKKENNVQILTLCNVAD